MAKGEQIVNLREFRKQYNVTQETAAKKLGIDQRQWSRYENGINDLPLHYFIKLCKEFKISADWLIQIPLTEEEEGNK